jgi:8-oxo-dGTP pyrophosphatase MutT (NUDIX family)
MDIDQRLNEIDDCLYRVATKALVVNGGRVLLVKEIPEMWWGFPGGGVDHGEAVETSLIRELEEELGVSSENITTDFTIAHHTIGTIVDGIPRMNVFYKVDIPEKALKETNHIAEWRWFTRDEFMKLGMSPSYKDRSRLAQVIFGG